MFKKSSMMSAITGAMIFANGFALAADQDRTRLHEPDKKTEQSKEQDRTPDMVYGSRLMTKQERNQFRKQMREAKTDKERGQIRAEHHERMQVRAKERGVTLPDDPPAMGSGMGSGMGGGMGTGGGIGAGGKR